MGKKLTKEHRENLSKGKRRYWREHLSTEALPERKRCSRCGKVKDASAFSIRKYKRKSVPVVEKLDAACRECNARIAKKRRDRYLAEGIDVRAIEKARNDRRKRGLSKSQLRELREKSREYSAAQRRKKGAKPRGAYGARKTLHERDKDVSRAPIAKWLREESGVQFLGQPVNGEEGGVALVARQTGVSERRIQSILKAEQPFVRLSTVDRILIGLDAPFMLHELYPET